MNKDYQHREPSISRREIERKYAKLIDDVKTKEYYTKVDLTNRVNCYSCGCGHITKSIDVDSGVTPMFFSCEKCGGKATSSFFKDIAPNQEPTIEWFRPSLKEVLKLKSKPYLLDHILNGGLEFRKK